jgi:hypothetical protein
MLLVLPFAAWRRRRRIRHDPLVVFLLGLLALYGYGWLSQNWYYGRLISAVMIVAAIIVADEATKATRPFWIGAGAVGLLVLSLVNTTQAWHVLPVGSGNPLRLGWRFPGIEMMKPSELSVLSPFVRQGQVVISNASLSLEAAAFGAKSVWSDRPQMFVGTGQRQADVARFFDPSAAPEARRAVICRYGVSFLLMTPADSDSQGDGPQSLLRLGPMLYRNDRYVLVDLRSQAPCGEHRAPS